MITPEEFEDRSQGHKVGAKRFLKLHNHFSSVKNIQPQPVEFFFYATRKECAEALRTDLEKFDYELYESDVSSDGRYSIIGATKPIILTDENLGEWVQKMNELGFINDCEFDGWGALSGPFE